MEFRFKILIGFIISHFVSLNIQAQVILKNHISIDLYNDYSQSIDLFQSNRNFDSDTVSIFLSSNQVLRFLNDNKYEEIYGQKNANSITNFIGNNSVNQLISTESLNNYFKSDKSLNSFVLNSGKRLYFDKNRSYVLIGDDYRPEFVQSETNIIRTVLINGRIALNFLQGVIQY